MKRNNICIAASLVSLAAVAGLGGCASKTDIDVLRKEIHEANVTARRARDEALAASQMAGEARSIAEEAKARAVATDARIDRMSK
ncbi:MAG: hypothetical protein BMS9Abin09_0622 [Gammaproteobacteria bacterium]|nr:MAG: hypothetical protein BMS9Abin09_0622 [Gammaproteobacteria bacterium]